MNNISFSVNEMDNGYVFTGHRPETPTDYPETINRVWLTVMDLIDEIMQFIDFEQVGD